MTGRERREELFRERGVKYKGTTHPEVYTAQEVAAVEHVSGYAMAKTVAVSADGKLVLVVLPAPHRVDITKVKRALGAGGGGGGQKGRGPPPSPPTGGWGRCRRSARSTAPPCTWTAR